MATVEEGAIIILVIITAIYVVLTYFILRESKLQRQQDNLHVKQDAELRTMPTKVFPGLHGSKDAIYIVIEGGSPILSRNFKIILFKENKDISEEYLTSSSGIHISDIMYIVKFGEILIKHLPIDDTFKLHIIVKFKSFLGNDYEYKFKSVNLIRNHKGQVTRSGKKPHRGPDFVLTEVIPPWVKR